MRKMDKVNRSTCLVLMAGLTGAGKSQLARALGSELGWPVIDKDVFKTCLLDAGMPDKAAGRASYDITLSLAEDLLVGQGLSIIVDTPALYPEVVDRAVKIATAAGATLKVVYCTLDLDTRRVRLAGRKGLRSQPSAPHAHEGDGTALFGHLPPDTLCVVTDRPVTDLLAEVFAYLGQGIRSSKLL